MGNKTIPHFLLQKLIKYATIFTTCVRASVNRVHVQSYNTGCTEKNRWRMIVLCQRKLF